jgi:glutathione peroxidase
MIVKSLYRKFRRVLVVLLMLVLAFWGYVEFINRNTHNMSLRQKILRAIYPAYTSFKKITGRGVAVITNKENLKPVTPVYDLFVELNNGEILSLQAFKGKKILFVNTASDCGYTAQYADLQQLHIKYPDKLAILGFPANDFKEQEKGTDEEIAQFCKLNYGVSFRLTKKTTVVKGELQHEVFKWLTDPALNGWNKKEPSWNFSKYIVNEEGILTHYFGPALSPLSQEVLDAIK